jgi:hypothetical protein
MRYLALVLLLALAAAPAALTPATAQPVTPAAAPVVAPAPVAIDGCSIMTNIYYPPLLRGAVMRWVTTAGLKIIFHSKGPQAAVDVRFLVEYRGDVEVIDDVGNFSAGVKINHSYSHFEDFAYLGTHPNICRVVRVKLADGTIWSAEGRRQSSN